MSESASKVWVYGLTSTSSTKRGKRVFTPYGLAYDMIGVDGSAHGGVRPHPGFKWVTDLSGIADSSGSAEQEIVLFEPVTFRVDATQSAWGFVTGIWDAVTTRLKLYVTYRLGPDSTTWLGPTLLKNTAVVEDADTKQNSVIVHGRFVYVLVEGEEPLLFYYDTDTTAIVAYTDTGPGAQPSLDSFVQTISVESGQTPQDTIPENLAVSASVLPGIAVPPSTEPSKGKMYPVAFYGLSAPSARWIGGPSDLSLWASAPTEMVDPTFNATGDVWLGGLGGLSGNSVATSRPPSYYTFAYQLYDSTTGRTSQLSQLANIAVGNLDTGPLAINAQGELVAWALLELVYDSVKYDSVYLYRSVQGESNAILHQDALILLEDYEAASQTGMTGDFVRAYYFYQLPDPVLASQQTFLGDSLLYEDDMPMAGAALLYDGCALFGKIGGFDTETAGLGFIRWSNTYDVTPEQVSPSNEYPLSDATEEVIGFAKAGPNVIAYSLGGLYHIRKEGFVIKATPLQVGFGSPSNRGMCSVGSECYLISESGLKLVGTMGEIANVEVMDDLVQSTWAGQVSSVQLAYDSTNEIVWIYNPVRGTAALLWNRTSEFTELYDLPFEHVREGKVPTTWGTDNRAMQKRAIFVQKILPSGDAGDPQWRVFVMDYQRAKSQRHLLDVNNPSLIFTLAHIAETNTLIGPTGGFNKLTGRLEGARVYALDSTRAGLSGVIKRVIADNLLEMEDDTTAGILAGTRMGISPVFLQWTGHGCGILNEQLEGDGTPVPPYDYSRVRSVEAIGCVFTDISGATSTSEQPDAKFTADLYRGNSSAPVNGDAYYLTFPTAPDGDEVSSVVEGPGVYWAKANVGGEEGGVTGSALFPTVRIFVPDLDYTMLNVLVRGSQRTAMTESFATTG